MYELNTLLYQDIRELTLQFIVWNMHLYINAHTHTHTHTHTSLMTQQVKNLPAMQEMQETWVHSRGQEDSLEEVMGTDSSILARKIP